MLANQSLTIISTQSNLQVHMPHLLYIIMLNLYSKLIDFYPNQYSVLVITLS